MEPFPSALRSYQWEYQQRAHFWFQQQEKNCHKTSVTNFLPIGTWIGHKTTVTNTNTQEGEQQHNLSKEHGVQQGLIWK